MTADASPADSAGDRGYEGSNVFLAAVDPERFAATLANPADLAAFEDRPVPLDDRDRARLGAVEPGDRNAQMFERMAPGDLVLCYADGAYVGAGRVALTFVDSEGWVAETLWDGDETERVYVLEDFTSVEIPVRVVNALFEYSPDYAPGGLIRVADGRVDSSLAAIRVALERYSQQRA